jgi:hypothetical protein
MDTHVSKSDNIKFNLIATYLNWYHLVGLLQRLKESSVRYLKMLSVADDFFNVD